MFFSSSINQLLNGYIIKVIFNYFNEIILLSLLERKINFKWSDMTVLSYSLFKMLQRNWSYMEKQRNLKGIR